jgi:DNA-binding MarR family transcriptional regulator
MRRPRSANGLSAMTTAVTGLERSGLVERQGDPADKRVALVAITDAGLKAMQARRRMTAHAVQQLIDKLPDNEAAILPAAYPALEHLRELAAEAWEATSLRLRRAAAGEIPASQTERDIRWGE